MLQRWEQVLTGLEHDPPSVASMVDWVAKQRLVDGYAERHGIEPGSARLKAIDLQYHDLRPDKGLAVAGRAGDDRRPGRRRRRRHASRRRRPAPYFRGRCLDKYPDEIVAANWDSIVFDVGREPLRRVPMMEPLRGTADHVARLIDESDSAVELLERLGS